MSITGYSILSVFVISLTMGVEAAVAEEARPPIEEIVVTATKRAQNISDVAGSISAIGADAIEERNNFV